MYVFKTNLCLVEKGNCGGQMLESGGDRRGQIGTLIIIVRFTCGVPKLKGSSRLNVYIDVFKTFAETIFGDLMRLV
ncbi:hypothetical protein L2E82_25576 [Cichorium intybus]|uniref:Uncharacterized protein n=1 Tax=Cichorium intybus TaxID=13427 RepID=A0ACB9E500_CICIN|nr:hypothetical protein L2E82_25576 [Cichorium intybus]